MNLCRLCTFAYVNPCKLYMLTISFTNHAVFKKLLFLFWNFPSFHHHHHTHTNDARTDIFMQKGMITVSEWLFLVMQTQRYTSNIYDKGKCHPTKNLRWSFSISLNISSYYRKPLGQHSEGTKSPSKRKDHICCMLAGKATLERGKKIFVFKSMPIKTSTELTKCTKTQKKKVTHPLREGSKKGK